MTPEVVCKFLKSLLRQIRCPLRSNSISEPRGGKPFLQLTTLQRSCHKYGSHVKRLSIRVTCHKQVDKLRYQTWFENEFFERNRRRESYPVGQIRSMMLYGLSDRFTKHPFGCTPYKQVYRKSLAILPIELEHKAYWALKHTNFDLKTAGDHRKVQLNELNELRDETYENSLIYKEKTKRIHDSKIKNRVFNVGDRILLFNSRLKIFSGKLKTRWSGPFTITQVFPYGTIELSQNSGPNFKVNGHRIKHYFGGDVPQLQRGGDFKQRTTIVGRDILTKELGHSEKSGTMNLSVWTSVDYSMEASHSMIPVFINKGRLVKAIDSLVPLDKHFATFQAWERFKGLLRQCPHHGFSELHQLDTFYNSLNSNDQDALDSAAGGNFLDKMPQEGLAIIESKSKVRYSRSRASDSRVSTDAPLSNSSPSNNSFDMQQIAASLEDKMTIKMKQMMNEMKALVVTTPAPVKAVEEANDAVLKNVQNQGQSLQNQMANVTSLLTSLCNNFKNPASTSNSGTLPSQTVTNPRQQINAITTRSGKTLEEPSTPLVPTPDISKPQNEPNPETSTEKVQNLNLENTTHVPPPGEEDSIFMEIPNPKVKKTVNLDPNSPNPKPYQSKLPYPERMKVRENDKPSAQHSQFLKMFKQLRLEIGLKDALVEMPKFNKWLSSLLRNKEKLEEIAIMTVNAECSAIIMNKVPEKLEDPGKFLIPRALQELNRTSALADSGASINLLPHSIYKKLDLEALTPTRITLELANHSITHPMGIAEDVVVRVDGFTFLADFVVVNFEPDPRVPIILGRPFLRTAKALIDLYEEKLTLRVGKEELIYYADKSEKNKEKNFVHSISIIDFSKDDPFSGSTTNTLPPSSSPMKTSYNFEKFTDELAPLDSLPPGNDDTNLKKDFHEVNFQVYSNTLFEFDDNFKSSNVNPLFEENDKDVEIKSSSSFTLTSPEESEFEAYLERESIPQGIDLTLPSTLEVLSSNPTSPTLTGEKDLKKDLTILFDSSKSNILPSPLFDSDSPFTAELLASVTLNSLGNEDKVFKPGILVYHTIHDSNLVTLEENLTENISSETLLVFKEPSFLLPPPEPPDEGLNFEPILVMKNVVLNETFYQSKVEDVNSFKIIIWTFLPFFTYTKESPLIFSFRSENFVFDPDIVTFHKPMLSMAKSVGIGDDVVILLVINCAFCSMILKVTNEVWISQKSQENSQKQASTDTRIRRVQKEAKDQSRSQKSQASVKASVKSGIVNCTIITPPYTPQHNGVSERRNRTLLNMVRSMMNLTTLSLSFWDYALESATRILNMVPTKKVDKTPYELWYGKVPNLSYLKVWGCEALVKRDTPDKLQQRSVNCARYAEFFEKNLITQEVSGRAEGLEEIQDEDTSPSEITSEIPMEVEGFEPPQEEVIPIRRSERTHRAPERLCLNVEVEEHSFVDLKHPRNVCKLKDLFMVLSKHQEAGIIRFVEEYQKFGFTQNILLEPCVYQKASGSNVTFLILYVDDIIVMGNHILSLQSVKDYLGKCFAMKDLREAAFILGIKIYRDRLKRLIGLSQSAYMDKILKRYRMDNSKCGHIPMQERLDLNKTQGASTPEEVKHMQNVPYALAVGSIMYAVRCTRPDVAFANTKDMFLVFGGNLSTKLRVECYYDAGSWFLVEILAQNFILNGDAVDWKISKQSTTAMSATESEYIAASEAAMEAVWIRKFISGLGIVPTINEPLNMYCDNSAAVHYANEPGVQKGARHYQRRYHYVRECVELGEIRILKVHTDNNLADPFTKALSNRKLTQHARGMGLRPASSFM
ncbi:retrotransposon protein, putative, ty1-copia subclass [Tanacetum coccineum]